MPVPVRFRTLGDAEIEFYLRTEQPYDCAGSAKCETLGIALLEAIESDDPTALIGLPLIQTCALLRAAGLDPLRPAPAFHRIPHHDHLPQALGRLLLMPNALDLGAEEVPLTDVLAGGVIAQASKLLHWVVEDARSARAFLNRVNKIAPLAQPLQQTLISELPRTPKGPQRVIPGKPAKGGSGAGQARGGRARRRGSCCCCPRPPAPTSAC